MDNAGNCNTTAVELGKLIPTFRGSAARTRCFPHIINLIAKVNMSHAGEVPAPNESISRLLYLFSSSSTREKSNLVRKFKQVASAKMESPISLLSSSLKLRLQRP